MSSHLGVQPTTDRGRWLKQGAIGGIVAGLVFAAFEMVMASVLSGPAAFFMPLRMIGAIALGPQALEPAYSAVTAILVGAAVHLVLSAIFGAIFGLLVAGLQTIASSTAALLVLGSIYGLAVWLVNFYLLAPLFGWVWFPNDTNPIVQFVAHTFFFGSVLGLYLARAITTPQEAISR